MEDIKKINKRLLAFEILPCIVLFTGFFLTFTVGMISTVNYGIGDKELDLIAITVLITFITLYVVTIITEIIIYFKFTRKLSCDKSKVELSNRIKVTKVLSILYMIPLLYFVAFYFRLLHVRSFRENKHSGQPAYHFWEFFIKENRKPLELKDFYKPNR
ncbi:DUF5083 family protein [Mammaliicoccus sp. Dog046]|uniref:DUF5083 family protein n=1 Tax=Mammaliicoccus sp. Dog046 TaxID=3034233 RepID=UPI002B25C991|nr:DUF5083 family protein [Mammaliicoccus sp. Dog046]WQK85597.1 DUF5083 family protein [Mammaliicoccus sp. Dog046]